MSRTDAISRAEQQVRVRPLSDAAAAIVNSFAPHPNPHRAAARRQAAMVEEDKEDNDSDDVPSLYESSDRDSDADEYEEEARRFLHYQLSAVPERAAAVSASTFYASHRTRTQTQRRSVDPSVHPQFRTKTVCELFCTHCDMMLCRRGMSAILLGDTSVNLYSTDVKPDNLEYVGLACEFYQLVHCYFIVG